MADRASPLPRAPAAPDQSRGLAVIIGTEIWERFAYYGMQSLLVLYMRQFLFLPGHIGNVLGLPVLRGWIEVFFGPLTPAALASAIFGLYAGGVYLTPVAGGVLGDRVLGRTAAVTLGVVLMAAGHFLMALQTALLPALALLLIGIGCVKGNLAGQLGQLYERNDKRRADAFQLYLLGVNLAAIGAPLVCGTLGQKLGWSWGFAAAGMGMLIGLAIYLSGRRWLPLEMDARAPGGATDSRSVPGEGKVIRVLVALIPVLMLVSLGNMEIFNAYIVWASANYDLRLFGQAMPATWLISLDAFIGSGLLVASLLFWRWWARRRGMPSEITRLAIGGAIAVLGPLCLAAASANQMVSHQKVGLGWAVAFHIVNDLGFVNIFPAGLALFSRAAPGAAGFMVGLYYTHLFLTNLVIGWLGGLLDRMRAPEFWLLHAALVAVGACLLLMFRFAFANVLVDREPDQT